MKNLIKAEFMKIFKRWNVYVLLFLLLFFLNIPTLMAISGKLQNPTAYYLPQIFRTQLSSAATTSSLMAILVVILCVSSIGGEYGWGTLRTVLVRGVPRRDFLTAKLLAILCVLLLWYLALLLISLPLGWAVMLKAKQEISWGFLNISGGITLLQYLARTYYTVIPAVILGFFWTVAGRSLGVGMGAAIVHIVVADPLMFGVLRRLGGFWAEIPRYTMMGLGRSLVAFGDNPGAVPFSDPWLAALVLLAYIVVFGVLAFRIFGKSDIRFTAA